MTAPASQKVAKPGAGSPSPAYALFPTPIGRCGIVWTNRGIVGIQLPEHSVAETRKRIAERHPGAVSSKETPPLVARAVGLLERHLGGKEADLSQIDLEMTGFPEFHCRVYERVRSIPAGATVTYGQLADQLEVPGGARAVGQALARNPFPIIVPCHRVLAAGGKIGGFSANGGTDTKRRMLEIEGVTPTRKPRSDASRQLAFDPPRAVRHLKAADPTLGELISAAGPFTMELQSAASTFAALSEAIVHQQLNPRAASTIHGRFRALFGRSERPSAEKLAAIDDGELRGAGLSQAKVRAIRDLSERVLSGEVPTLEEAAAVPDEQLIERLTTVRGVGRWTAEMFLMFRLGRPDVLPLGDYGLRRGFAITFNDGSAVDESQVQERGERWRPYRTVASWYLWRAAETTPL